MYVYTCLLVYTKAKLQKNVSSPPSKLTGKETGAAAKGTTTICLLSCWFVGWLVGRLPG